MSDSEAFWFLKAYPLMVLQACKWWAGIPETSTIKSVDEVKYYLGQTLSKEKMEEQRNKDLAFKRLLRDKLQKFDQRYPHPTKDELEAKREELEEKHFEETRDIFNNPYRPSRILEISVTDEYDQKDKVYIRDWDTNPVIDTWFSSGSHLLSDPHIGSAGIGIAIFTLPLTLPLSPILLPINGVYSLLEKAWGMSRRTHKLYRGLMKSDLLSKEEKEIIKQACFNMEKEWKEQVEYAKKDEELERQIYTT